MLRQKVTPDSTSCTPWRTFSGVSRLMRPSSSSSPQSPQVEPGGRCVHLFGISLPHPWPRCTVDRPGVPCDDGSRTAGTPFPHRGGHRMTQKDFVVSGDGHLLEPIALFPTRLPKPL